MFPYFSHSLSGDEGGGTAIFLVVGNRTCCFRSKLLTAILINVVTCVRSRFLHDMHLWVRELSQIKDTIRLTWLTNGLYGYGTREIEIN